MVAHVDEWSARARVSPRLFRRERNTHTHVFLGSARSIIVTLPSQHPPTRCSASPSTIFQSLYIYSSSFFSLLLPSFRAPNLYFCFLLLLLPPSLVVVVISPVLKIYVYIYSLSVSFLRLLAEKSIQMR